MESKLDREQNLRDDIDLLKYMAGLSGGRKFAQIASEFMWSEPSDVYHSTRIERALRRLKSAGKVRCVSRNWWEIVGPTSVVATVGTPPGAIEGE